ncbi:chromosome segregation protein SMC [Bacillus sp. HMF5848]|uniref:chromosome segregation protein SMC n=1 Tax=Bacillus sp. HMF5848 TaxID=2495421 RepID=UPI000F76E9DC|nr:chromosome segregation protein SMC [Bacillus sp. HMF5848]RSK26995.1 chromosome segregation protein SMC [Bacillus sp. HMF5848]
MFLKRLDIVGFKSFAERVSIDFVSGVTAVVGPNGSGKSNITDSIRWVLGEQSAKSLRGAKMEDIIFAGSDSRKALNVAEVTLTLDNEDHFLPIDYHEVSVTRCVYRSGDSEFFINKQACRLKDIIDLFMDSGLGREAFSIISQGKVEEILSSKAEERRTIFEEAAGVLKYKTRKKKAEYKLAETQENLNRVTDILYELEQQIEPLQVQSSIAKDYLQQKEELEKSEVSLMVHDIEERYEKWEQLKESYEKTSDLELASATELQKHEANLTEKREQLQALDESIEDLQQVLLLTSEELEKLEGRKEVLKERKKNTEQNKQQLIDQAAELTKRKSELQEAVQQETVKKADLVNELDIVKADLDEKDKLVQTYSENIEEEIEQLKSDYIELLNEQATQRNEQSHISSQLKQHETKSTRLLENNKKYVEQRIDIETRKDQLHANLAITQKELNDQIVQFREQQRHIEQLKGQYQKKESLLYQAYQYLQQVKSRKTALEEMQDDYAGFYQGVKEVLKAKETHLTGVEGAVAEVIQVPKVYETAIEIALGPAMQHVVVATEHDARQAIQYLKQHSFGRATFLPLTVIKERVLSSSDVVRMSSHPAFVGVAADIITCDEKYRKVVSNLLGTVVITKDLKGANELAKLVNHRCRFVTVEGDVVNPGGSMTGGAVKQKGTSLLSRNRELEEIQNKLSDMEGKTKELEVEVKQVKLKITTSEENLDNLRQTGEKLRLSEQAVRSDIKQIEMEEKNVNEQLSIYDSEQANLTADKYQLSERYKELVSSLEGKAEEIRLLDKKIKQLTEQKQQNQTSKEALQAELTELKVFHAEKKQQFANVTTTLSRLTEELTATSKKLTYINEDLDLLKSGMYTDENDVEKLQEAASDKQAEKNNVIQLISVRREERLNLQATIEHKEQELKELKRQVKQFNDVLKDYEVKINRLDVELDNLLHHLREEYMMSFEAAKEAYPLQIEVSEARKRVKLIKLAIEELGTVNLGAIDEYERVSERFEFLTEQKDDLITAKETLFKVIGEMDDEMNKRFEETFVAIKSHFESVFQALFGGGRADLVLTDPQDLLHTGVEIVAQPPGKKLQNLGLLSGGERALTAIALLFSILKVRPVPFCVLDEVEAALDEANVQRFAQYLRKFSKETQFIVITHRKGTMEGADVLYGVTMQESGVSKLVSVRLEEQKALIHEG